MISNVKIQRNQKLETEIRMRSRELRIGKLEENKAKQIDCSK